MLKPAAKSLPFSVVQTKAPPSGACKADISKPLSLGWLLNGHDSGTRSMRLPVGALRSTRVVVSDQGLALAEAFRATTDSALTVPSNVNTSASLLNEPRLRKRAMGRQN